MDIKGVTETSKTSEKQSKIDLKFQFWLISGSNKSKLTTAVYYFSTILLKGITKYLSAKLVNDDPYKSQGRSFLNSPVISSTVVSSNGSVITTGIQSTIRLKIFTKVNKSMEQIPVFWKVVNSTHGYWSSEGCKRIRCFLLLFLRI